MIPASSRCSFAGCDDPAVSLRDHTIGPTCVRHRYHDPPVDHLPRTCPACGALYKPRRSDAIYCSKRCRNRLSARRTYVPRPRGPRQRKALTCEGCGTTYLGVWGRFCSRACTARAWKERNRDRFRAARRRYYASVKERTRP
jgi:predicted nucleic acid-binding Zn ribbon protein